MERKERMKVLNSEELKKIDPKNIAYLTLIGGEVIVVNGLNHSEYNKKEKEYLKHSLKNKNKNVKKTIVMTSSNLKKIQESSEENERNINRENNEELNSIIRPTNTKYPDENPNDIIPELICPINSNQNKLKPQQLRTQENKYPDNIQINESPIEIKNNYINYNRVTKNCYTMDSNNKKVIYLGNITRMKQSHSPQVKKRYNTKNLINNNSFRGKELNVENYSYDNNFSNFGTFIDPNNNSVKFSVRPRNDFLNSYNNFNQFNHSRSLDRGYIIKSINTNNFIPEKSYGCLRCEDSNINNCYREIKCSKKALK